MKKVNLLYTAFVLAILSFYTTITAFAQDGGSSSTTVTTSSSTTSAPAVDENWLAANWLWIAGGVIVLIIIIALLSGRSRDTTVEKTTVIRDRDI